MFYLMMRLILIMHFILWNVLFNDAFNLMMCFIFKALFSTPFSNHSPIISNNAYPFLSNSKFSFKL